MDEYKLEDNTFMGGWYIPKGVCDELKEYYDSRKDEHIAGQSGEGLNPDFKKCTELYIKPYEFNDIDRYLFYLQECLDRYKEKYPYADQVNSYSINSNVKIQHYKPGEAYYAMHMENSGQPQLVQRHLVFMTYLDTLDNAGTEFYHQKLTTPCEKGLTLIWPAGWTHMHRGVTNTVGDKSIITGWYTFQYTEEQYKNIQDANHSRGILHEFINNNQ